LIAICERRAASSVLRLADDGDGVLPAPVVVLYYLARVHERKQEIVDRFRSGNERSLESAGVDVIRGQARFVGPRKIRVTAVPDVGAGDVGAGDVGARSLSAGLLVINTGLQIGRAHV